MNNNIIKNVKNCFPFLKKCKKEFSILIILGIINTIFYVVNPALTANIINDILSGNFNKVFYILIFMGTISFLSTIFNILISKNYLIFRKKMVLDIRNTVCRSLLNFNVNTYSQNGQGLLINRLNSDSSNIVSSINTIKESLFNGLKSIGILIYIFYLNYIIGIFYLFTTIISIIIRYIGISKQMKLKNQLLQEQDSNTTLIGEVVKGVKDIKVLNLKNKFSKETSASFEKIGKIEYKSSYVNDLYSKIASFSESIFLGIMILFSIFLIKENLLTTSMFVIIFMYRDNVYSFSSKFSNLINSCAQFNLSCNRVFSILNNNLFSVEKYGDDNIKKPKGNIEFKNISFKYDKNNVFENLNLKISEKSFVGIVGKSGAGKSTMFNLITKMYVPQKGEILIDGHNLNNLSEQCIRNSISMIGQHPYLFNFSIKKNLSIVRDNITMEEIEKVCKDVSLDKLIKSLPKGYDTKVGEGGVNLSGGEKQRLAIARCLLLRTPIILFDEITSSLDNETSDEIRKVIERLKGKYTIIVIAHKLDMIKNCDRILVVDNGKIVGDGTHDKLISNNKYYQKLNINNDIKK